jgi:hypothetical protein
MKVCFISHSSSRGGAERSMRELIDALSRREVLNVCVLPCRGPLCDPLADRGVETILVPYRPWVHSGNSSFGRLRRMLPLPLLPAALRLATEIKRSRCDVVLTNTITVEGMKLGKPIIGTRSDGTPEIVQEEIYARQVVSLLRRIGGGQNDGSKTEPAQVASPSNGRAA